MHLLSIHLSFWPSSSFLSKRHHLIIIKFCSRVNLSLISFVSCFALFTVSVRRSSDLYPLLYMYSLEGFIILCPTRELMLCVLVSADRNKNNYVSHQIPAHTQWRRLSEQKCWGGRDRIYRVTISGLASRERNHRKQRCLACNLCACCEEGRWTFCTQPWIPACSEGQVCRMNEICALK